MKCTTKYMMAVAAAFVICEAFSEVVEVPASAAYANRNSAGGDPSLAINGAGLDEKDGILVHTKYSGSNSYKNSMNTMWLGASAGDSVYATWFIVDLGAVQWVDQVKIWNYNREPKEKGFYNRGVKKMDILASVADDVAIPALTDGKNCNYDWSEQLWSVVSNGHSVAASAAVADYAGEAPIEFASPVKARWIGFRINSIHDSAQKFGGLSEVKFYRVATAALSLLEPTVSGSSATVSAELSLPEGTDTADVVLRWGSSAGSLENSTVLSDCKAGPISHTLTDLAENVYYSFSTADKVHGGEVTTEVMQLVVESVEIEVTMPDNFFENDPFAREIVFTRPDSRLDEPLTVGYSLGGTAAAAYASQLTGTVTIPVGARSASVPFSAVDDSAKDGDVSLTVSVLPPLSGSVASVLILDDESASDSLPVWDGEAGDQLWATARNWSADKVPTIVDKVAVHSGASEEEPIVITGEYNATKTFVTSSANGSDVTFLELADGARLHVAGNLGLAGVGASTLTVRGGELTIAGSAYVGNGIVSTAQGRIVIEGGRVSNGGGASKFVLANGKGSSGSVLVKGGKLSVATSETNGLRIGDTGRGTLRIEGGEVGLSGSSVRVGYGSTGQGTVEVVGGQLVSGSSSVDFGVERGSTGCYLQSGGEASFVQLRAGVNAGSSARMDIGGGKLTVGTVSPSVFGVGGFAEVVISNEAQCVFGRQFQIGTGASATGVVTICGVTVSDAGADQGDGYMVGDQGHGELLLVGGTLKSAKKDLCVRNRLSGFGRLGGWGEVEVAHVQTKGVIVADGFGDEHDLSFTNCTYSGVINGSNASGAYDSDNTTTNGWYAVNRGRLLLKPFPVTGSADATVGCNWGEPYDDMEIDLVNSVRFEFEPGLESGRLSGELLATDRSDVPAFPRGVIPSSVWRFAYDAGLSPVDMEFRYDHIAVGEGNLAVMRYDETAGSWRRLKTVVDLDRKTASVSGVQRLGLFAVGSIPAGLTIFVR